MKEAEVQSLAAWQAVQIVNTLRAAGWVFVAVVVWTRKDDDGLAGASYFDLPKAFAGAMPRLADAVRTVAREIDDAHRAIGGAEWTGDAYTHTIGGSAIDARAQLARERVVLQGMADVPEAVLDRVARLDPDLGPSLALACQAELNRRKGKPCRRCSECDGEHHWIEYVGYVCKHCEAIAPDEVVDAMLNQTMGANG
jgi:hypothetical protein